MKLGRRTVEPGRRRRRLSSGLTLALALGTVGVGYSVLAPSSAAEDSGLSVEATAGQELFELGCITCHGANLQGVDNRGPSLVGIGEAAVYFQVSTGRMPCVQNEAQCPTKDPIYTDAEVNQLMAYIQESGGGPTLPSGDLRDGDLAEGGELFRLNCASCHNFAGRGGALSSGKYAPSLAGSSDLVIYSAMLSGPQSMPVFGDNQLTPEQKRAVINYIQTLKESQDPGGLGIGRAGPVPEGLVIWLVGIVACIGAALWVGSRT